MKSNFNRNKIKDFKSILCINLSHLFSYSIHDPIVLREHGLVKNKLKAEADFNELGF